MPGDEPIRLANRPGFPPSFVVALRHVRTLDSDRAFHYACVEICGFNYNIRVNQATYDKCVAAGVAEIHGEHDNG